MLEQLIETYGEAALGAAGGLALGALFGVFAQRSRFCMRSATIETARRGPGERFAVWALALATALVAVQAAVSSGLVSLDAVRPLNGRGSLSGALIGGGLFGIGMVLARGCVSRLLVLSASGNLRAVATTTVFALVALATMRGPLASARDAVAGLSPIEGRAALDLGARSGLGPLLGIGAGVVLFIAAIAVGLRRGLTFGNAIAGIVIGGLVTAGYLFTSALNGASFDPQPVQGLSFIAPYANGLAMALGQIAGKIDFTLALLPGVALGALVAALASREFRIEVFPSAASTVRYGAGAVLMGFGGVVATGCSLGNGVSGVAALSTTAFAALIAMWAGATLTDYAFDRERRPAPVLAPAE